MNNNQIVERLWSLCNVLRDDGITYHEYVTELTYILFLKMAEERGIEEELKIPLKFRWSELIKLKKENLFNVYKDALLEFSIEKGKLGSIYHNAITKIEDKGNLAKIFYEINRIEWDSLEKDDMGDLYEGLLAKNAGEKKSGAGQYFTPRVLIDSIVRLVKPKLGEKIFDPAGGTLGFLISASIFLKNNNKNLSTEEFIHRNKNNFFAMELVADTHRLAIMNAFLHSIDGEIKLGDTLSSQGKEMGSFDLILSNPPFGVKRAGERPFRDDLKHFTFNKQLNFLQIIYNSLKPNGRAVVILPDNVLFERGIGVTIRKELMEKCNLHTILRLPTGIFHAQGVKTNVLFFNNGGDDRWNTKEIWYYDLRSNLPNFNKSNPLKESHFKEFEKSFNNDNDKEKLERWTKVNIEEIEKNEWSLNMGLIKDNSMLDHEDLPNPIENAEDAIEKLEQAVDLLKGVIKDLHIAGVER